MLVKLPEEQVALCKEFMHTLDGYRQEKSLPRYYKAKSPRQLVNRYLCMQDLTAIARGMTYEAMIQLMETITDDAPTYKTYWMRAVVKAAKERERSLQRGIEMLNRESWRKTHHTLDEHVCPADARILFTLYSESNFRRAGERLTA